MEIKLALEAKSKDIVAYSLLYPDHKNKNSAEEPG